MCTCINECISMHNYSCLCDFSCIFTNFYSASMRQLSFSFSSKKYFARGAKCLVHESYSFRAIETLIADSMERTATLLCLPYLTLFHLTGKNAKELEELMKTGEISGDQDFSVDPFEPHPDFRFSKGSIMSENEWIDLSDNMEKNDGYVKRDSQAMKERPGEDEFFIRASVFSFFSCFLSDCCHLPCSQLFSPRTCCFLTSSPAFTYPPILFAYLPPTLLPSSLYSSFHITS